MNLAGLGFVALGRSLATPCWGASARDDLKFPHHIEFVQRDSARELGISLSTVERTWAFARAWLFREMQQLRNSPA